MAGAWVTRRNPICLRSTPFGFAAIRLARETPFRALGKARCFVYDGFVVALETREARLDPGDGAGRETVA
jgi:hypothetical protein